MEFSNENVINAVQNEGVLWDATINASEEQKELAITLAPKLTNMTDVHATTISSSAILNTI